MLGGELVFHFINVMLMTVLVAPLILWRYRRAVLAGMQDRGGAALPLAPVVARRPTAPRRRTRLRGRAGRSSLGSARAPPRLRRRARRALSAGAAARGAIPLPRRPADHAGAHLPERRRHLQHGRADLRRADRDAVLARAQTLADHALRPRRLRRAAVDAAAAVLRQGADARPGDELRLLLPVRGQHAVAADRCSAWRSARGACAASRRSPSPACWCSRSRRCSACASRSGWPACAGARAGCSPGRASTPASSSSPCRSACSPGGA